MVGIICAMKIEAESLISGMDMKDIDIVSGIEFCHGVLCGHEVTVAVSGVGKVFAAVCASVMINKFGASLILNSGVAGTLTDKLHTCDIAVASGVIQHDMDTSAVGDPVGMISGINVIGIDADADTSKIFMEVCEKNGINFHVGIIASGDRFVNDKPTKDYIINTFGAIACDMESGAIGQVCYINRVPFAVIRAISDEADGSSRISYDDFRNIAAKRGADIICEFLSVL